MHDSSKAESDPGDAKAWTEKLETAFADRHPHPLELAEQALKDCPNDPHMAPCEYSYTWEQPREVCDERLHLVSPEANGPCPHCSKPYCRACHPNKCPKCGKSKEN